LQRSGEIIDRSIDPSSAGNSLLLFGPKRAHVPSATT
jgi:hypothetical protein